MNDIPARPTEEDPVDNYVCLTQMSKQQNKK